MSDDPRFARQNRLREVISDLGMADSIEEIIQIIRISARSVAGADGITFVRRNGDFVHYVAEDAIAPLWTGQSFPIQSCISGIAMLSHAPVIISDVFADPRVPHAAYEPTFVKSMAMFPLGLDEKVAAIGAYWARAGRIDQDTIETLSALASAAEMALDALPPSDIPPPGSSRPGSGNLAI